MLEDKYLYLILVVGIIGVLRVIYLLIQKSKRQKEELEKLEQEKKLRESALAKKKPIATEAINEMPITHPSKMDETPTPIKSQDEPKKKNDRSKRELKPHGKITKQSFNDFKGAKILVAEDNIINQKVIKGLLADTGIEIKIANDGQEALEILKKDSDFALILMDVHMPNLNGFEATKIIRANPKYEHIAVIALSGDTATDDLKKMADAGMERQLEKPLKIDALYDIMYEYTECDNETTQDEIIIDDIEELNVQKGLEICGNDKDFYNEILNEFIQTYQNTDDLQNYLKNEQLKEADKLLLDIVGVTSNIGADKLNHIATIIKESLNDSQEKSYLTLIEEYKIHLTKIIEDIKKYQSKI